MTPIQFDNLPLYSFLSASLSCDAISFATEPESVEHFRPATGPRLLDSLILIIPSGDANHGLGGSPPNGSLSPTMLVKIQEVYCVTFSNFDRFCSKNL